MINPVSRELRRVFTVVRAGLVLFTLVVLTASVCLGIAFSAWEGSLLGVALFALVPGSLVLSLLTSQPWWGEKDDRSTEALRATD